MSIASDDHGRRAGAAPGRPAAPYACPFCAEDDLRPVEDGGWHCRACLRVFSVTLHGIVRPTGAEARP